jgi:hypothetical protein
MTDKKTRPTTREEKITRPGVYEMPVDGKNLPAPKNKGGRPTIYTQDLADRICVRLSLGESIRSICRDAEMPSQALIYLWLNRNPAFLEQYTRAREEQAETHADQIVDIADETPQTMEVKDKDGNVVDIKLDSAYIAWQKQRIDARKWNASKQRPKKYGDRVTHGGDDESPVVVEHNLNVFGDLLKAIKLQRQSEV